MMSELISKGIFGRITPGPIVLFGSGETSPNGQKIFTHLFQRLSRGGDQSSAVRVAILETPAGFELNSQQVIGRVANFLVNRLQNFRPQVTIVPARKRGTPFSPDSADVVAPLLEAEMIFMGPGSPTYAVRQLKDSLAWQYLVARHRLGGALAFASAATIAVGAQSLPVYEIYKVGEELHWKEGLDFFKPFGASLVFVPHWNNKDGGEELDTSRCFMGLPRFEQLMAMLPDDRVVVGIDESTALSIDFIHQQCEVVGLGSVTVIRDGRTVNWMSGQSFALAELGAISIPEGPGELSADVWQQAVEVQNSLESEEAPPGEVIALVEAREAARLRKNWSEADAIREEIAKLGWQVQDTPEGPQLERVE